MAMIDLDKLKPALQSVSDAKDAWEKALGRLSQPAPDMDEARYAEMMWAVSDAEQKYHRSTSYLAYRVLELSKDANLGKPPA